MILVTGATGTVGSQVVRALLDKGVRIRAGVHTRPLEIDGVATHTIDFDQPETLPPALEGVRDVFLASYATLHEQALIPAAQDAGVERIVKLSAWRAADKEFMVGRWHRDVEQEIEGSGLAWTFLRPNFFMQNFVTWVSLGESIRRENTIYDTVEDARISHIDAQDIARVAARVLTESGHEGKTYDLSGPEALTLEEIAEILTEALGRTIRYVRISDEEYRQLWAAGGLPEEELDAIVDLSHYARTGATSAVTTDVQDLTGCPPTSFAEFFRDYAPAFTAKERNTKSQNNLEGLTS